MCGIADSIKYAKESHSKLAGFYLEPDLQEFHYHLAIEAEKFLRRHEAKCEECRKMATV